MGSVYLFIYFGLWVFGCWENENEKESGFLGFVGACVCFVYWKWESWNSNNRDAGMHEAIECFDLFVFIVLFGCSENAERKKIGFCKFMFIEDGSIGIGTHN